MLTKEDLNNICASLNIKSNIFNFFIESGTYMGDTAKEMSSLYKVKTIELAKLHYNECIPRFKDYSNIQLYFGDSSKEFKNMLVDVLKIYKCIFFLDGHYSSGNTAKGDVDVPLLNELNEIKRLRPNGGDLIIIDDYRLFGTNITEDWSYITRDSISKIYQRKFLILNDRFIFIT